MLYIEAGRCVSEPSFATYRQRTASVEDGTLSHNLPQQARAQLHEPAHCGGAQAWPIRRSRFSGIEGCQAARGGDGP